MQSAIQPIFVRHKLTQLDVPLEEVISKIEKIVNLGVKSGIPS
jgi:hypothetical protein